MDSVTEEKYQNWKMKIKDSFENIEKNEFIINAYLNYIDKFYRTEILKLLSVNSEESNQKIKEIEKECQKDWYLSEEEKLKLLFNDDSLIKMLSLYDLILNSKKDFNSSEVLEKMQILKNNVKESNLKIADEVILKINKMINKSNVITLTKKDVECLKKEQFDEYKLKENNFITDGNLNLKFFQIYVQYKLCLEKYLLKKIPIKRIDELFDKYTSNKEYYSSLNRKINFGVLKNIYLANILHIERLTKKQIELFSLGDDETKEKIVNETFKEIIKRDLDQNDDTMFFHIADSNDLVENLSIVFEVLSYSKNVLDFKDGLSNLSNIFNIIEKTENECSTIISIPVHFVEYKEFYNN